jgi:large subunit ribosomal protein L10
VLDEFAKDNKQLIIKTGAMGGKVMSEAELKALAKLPSRDELLAILMATMNAPVQKFVRTLNEVPSAFVRTLAAVRDAKEAA